MEVCVRDDLVQVGLTEDGEADLALCYYLVARAPDGRQWAHDHSRVAHRVNQEAARAELEALRARVASHLARGGRLDADHWNDIDPAYGSAAYQDLDATGYFLAAERQRDRDAGEVVPFDHWVDFHFAV